MTSADEGGGASAAAVDARAREHAAMRLAALAGTDGEAGRLGTLAVWWAGARGCCPAPQPERVRVLLLVESSGCQHSEAEPPYAGGAGAVVLAAAGASAAGIEVAAGELDPVHQGRRLADAEADAGTDLLVLGTAAARPAVERAAATLVAALLGREPVEVAGSQLREGRFDDARWAAEVVAVRDGLRTIRQQASGLDPTAILHALVAPALGMLAGVIAQAAARRTPMLLDGVTACAAALLAARWEPGTTAWLLAASRPTSPAGVLALDAMDTEPVLELGMRLGGAAAALCVVPLLRTAVELLVAPTGSDEGVR